jgi:adenylate cyclase class IV
VCRASYNVLFCRRLRNLTEDERDKSNLNELESRGILTSYARLETTRHCYKKDEVNIVVDDTDWDYRVGEIEIVVSEKKNVSAATSKIDAIAKELGEYIN